MDIISNNDLYHIILKMNINNNNDLYFIIIKNELIILLNKKLYIYFKKDNSQFILILIL